MASITIRNLDDASKQWLRNRAAANNRSMEEEARLLFSAARDGEEDLAQVENSGDDALPVSNAPLRFASLPAPQSYDLDDSPLADKHILLILCGGIANYKCLDLIRRLRERHANVSVIMTEAAQKFITPLTVSAISGERVYTELFNRDDEHDVGHIRMPRLADLVVVAPATANMLAKMAQGTANDLASTVLLAATTPILVAPAMNPAMWSNPATQRNADRLQRDGVAMIGPAEGEMAESGEAGIGRMAEPMEILAAMEALLDDRPKPLTGKRAVVTSGPTHEPIDPVRYLANRSSGKQGHAIAAALARAGADVLLVSGPVNIPNPAGVKVIHVENAREMRDAVDAALPADIAIFVAAVADWRTETNAGQKIKKHKGRPLPQLIMVENPDILQGVGTLKNGRPELVIGFAAETENLIINAQKKLSKKGADWIIANDVSAEHGVMGGDENTVRLISRGGVDTWPTLSKKQVANRLVENIAERFESVSV